MRRKITWKTTITTIYTATTDVPDEWLGEGEVIHLAEIVEPLEHDGYHHSTTRTFVESHPIWDEPSVEAFVESRPIWDEPSVEEITALLTRLTYVSRPGATQEEREAFLRDKRALLARIDPEAAAAALPPEVSP